MNHKRAGCLMHLPKSLLKIIKWLDGLGDFKREDVCQSHPYIPQRMGKEIMNKIMIKPQ